MPDTPHEPSSEQIPDPDDIGYQVEALVRQKQYGFDSTAEKLYLPLEQAWKAGRPATADELTKNLAYPGVFDALVNLLDRPGVAFEAITAFLGDGLHGTRASNAYPKAFLGRILESTEQLDAEIHYKSAILLDARCYPAHEQLVFISIDRGDYPAAIRHLQALDYADTSMMVGALRAGQDDTRSTGRNDPCPCGSGKKYKKCHAGQPIPGAKGQFRLADRLSLYLSRVAMDEVDDLVDESGAAPHEAFHDDLVVFEGGVLEEYLRARSSFIPDEDQQSLVRWLDTDRTLYEVTSVEPGVGLGFRRVDNGDDVTVAERSMSTTAGVGDYFLVRIAHDPDPVIVGTQVQVPLSSRDDVISLLGRRHDHYDLARWYGSLSAAPTLTNRDGHKLEPRVLTFAIDESGDAVSGWLDAEASAVSPDEWRWLVPFGDEEVVVARLTLIDSTSETCTLDVEVNSKKRGGALNQILLRAFPSARIVDRELIDVDDMSVPFDPLTAADGRSVFETPSGGLSDEIAAYLRDQDER